MENKQPYLGLVHAPQNLSDFLIVKIEDFEKAKVFFTRLGFEVSYRELFLTNEENFTHRQIILRGVIK